jgi:hypothetical protein
MSKALHLMPRHSRSVTTASLKVIPGLMRLILTIADRVFRHVRRGPADQHEVVRLLQD